jgi:hypothetical protein
LDALPTEFDTFAHTLVSLLSSVLREYDHLKTGYRDDQTLLIWACRNLLELKVFVQYVLQSGANAQKFYGDRLVDAIDIFKSLGKWKLERGYEANPEWLEIIAGFEREKDAEGITTTGYLNTKVLADSLPENGFGPLNRICSKFVHPTAFSVLTANERVARYLYPFFFETGARLGVESFDAIKEHVEKVGVRPRNGPDVRLG